MAYLPQGRAGRRTGGVVVALALAIGWWVGPVALAGGSSVDVQVVEDTGDRIVVQYGLGDYKTTAVEIDGREYVRVSLAGEPLILQAGSPELPRVCRSVIIPDDAAMALRIVDAQYEDLPEVEVVPSKGSLPRTVNPDDVPYTFGEAYQTDAFYPGPVAALGEPYILRKMRGAVIEFNPFQYNPVTRTLRVYTAATIEVARVGFSTANAAPLRGSSPEKSLAFHQVYKHQFINYDDGLRYTPLDEQGEMLILTYDAWINNVQPLAAHRTARGVATTVVGVSTIPGGNTSTAIKNYIQSVYNSSDLAFVLLVGDSTQVATPTASGGSSDPSYAKVGGTDNYPDIFVGRFSAETAAQVDTQVLRTIEYETLPATQQTWFKRGVGIASDEGGGGQGDDGESDATHIDNIRTDLLAHGYTTVDRIYDTLGATAAQVSAALNAGRGIINYCGHGSTTSWGTTGFSNSNVAALTNDNMLPFIFDVACVNGQFAGYTCFAEAWMRSTHNGEPIGAIGIYASSINQEWDPPMDAQDESVDLLVAESYATLGAMCFAGSCRMMDDYGSTSGTDGVNMFNTWHLFGDPAVRVVGVSGPTPPHAANGQASTAVFAPVTITLSAEDDGEPNPPGALTYKITALPTYELRDAGNGHVIAAGELPYTLVSGGNQAVYQPGWGFSGSDGFQFKANDGGTAPQGGDSNTATVSITVGGPQLIYGFPLDSQPTGWSMEGSWDFGKPAGEGTHNRDPNAGHTGNNVFGYNLNGDYTNSMPAYHLTTPALDCSGVTDVQLEFWRWLGVEYWTRDHATVEVSKDGTNWTTVWSNPVGVATVDTAWVQVSYDISSVADGEATVYVRWSMGATDSSVTYPGWNIDDIEIWAVIPPPPIPGDFDKDGDVDVADFGHWDGCMTGPGDPGGPGLATGCESFDFDSDEDVDLEDFASFTTAFAPG